NTIDVGADVVEAADIVAHSIAYAGRRAVFTESFAQRPAPFAGGDTGFGALNGCRHDVVAVGGRALQFIQRIGNGTGVACVAPGLQPLDLPAFGILGYGKNGVGGGSQRRRFALEIFVDADDDLIATLDRFQPRGVRLDKLLLQISGIDRDDGAAHLFDALELVARFALEFIDLARDLAGAVENIAVIEQVGFVS